MGRLEDTLARFHYHDQRLARQRLVLSYFLWSLTNFLRDTRAYAVSLDTAWCTAAQGDIGVAMDGFLERNSPRLDPL
jgi:hypothetical protein